MSQCVPSWDLDHDYPNFASHSTSLSLNPDVPKLDNEVAELTWQNGHLSMHGLGQPRVGSNIWEKPTHDTLEAIVNQSSFFPTAEELVPWFNHHKSVLLSTTTTPVTASVAGVMDALVPCTNNNITEGSCGRVMDSGLGTRVESCSGPTTSTVNKVRAARVIVPEWSSCPDNSVTESANTRQVTVDTCEKELGGGGFTSTSTGSPENTSSGKKCTGDDYDSVCHSRAQRETRVQEEGKKKTNKLSVSTKRSRAAAVHNQSERKRRDKINQRMKTLQKLVPNSSKTDKASMLDEVIEYLKQLQAQVNMMSRMNMSHMMLPYAMQQQQLQMSMMAPMMGMGMGMGMGIGPNIAGLSPSILHPAFISPWDGPSVDHRLHTPASLMHDPMSTFLAASQSQPMTMDAYSRMAALYQQLHQNSGSGPKN